MLGRVSSCFSIKLIDFSNACVGQRFLTCVIASITLGHNVSSIPLSKIIARIISMMILSILSDTLFSS